MMVGDITINKMLLQASARLLLRQFLLSWRTYHCKKYVIQLNKSSLQDELKQKL